MLNKEKLDDIILKYKAQPSGIGYTEIIVKNEFVEDFIMEILTAGFSITNVCWWEYCKTLDTKNKLGYGGPKSIYCDGWFSEICFTDDFPYKINITGNNMEKYKMVMDHIKYIKTNEIIRYDEILTPSFCIDVPDEWENIYYIEYKKKNI